MEDTFIVISGDPAAPFDAAVALTRQTVAALWRGPFENRPEKSVVLWVASSQAAADALVRRQAPWVKEQGLGRYDPHTRQIFVATNPAGLLTICHEIAHPLLRADLPLAPFWLSEGLPALFEKVIFSSDGGLPHFGAHFRLQTRIRTLFESSAIGTRLI